MGANTKIEWCDATWSPVTGCTPISPACDHCYAKRMARRLAGRCGYPEGDGFAVTVHRDKLDDPFFWTDKPPHKHPMRIFVVSMGDLFHPDVPDEAIDAVFSTILCARCHTFMVLTKRPQRMYDFIDRVWVAQRAAPMPNLWLGVTAENQRTADERIPILLQTPAAVRFISCEPLLGPLHLGPENCNVPEWSMVDRTIDWIIVGGETGPGARRMRPEWARSLRDQATRAGVPFFFKKWGMFAPEGQVGLHSLDGVEYHQLPEVRP